MQLSDRARQLIPKARIVSFATWSNDSPTEVIAIFQKADDEGRYLTDEDIKQIKTVSPSLSSSVEKAKLLREKAPDIVSEARKKLLEQFPNISQPGGELYPAERAEACWRDFWHFLRCITYGIAGQKTQFTSQEGLNNMQLLYEELRVPLEAMIVGLENLKTFGLKEFQEQEQEDLKPYFNRLIANMKQFQSR
ncbi:MAG: phycobilisome protein [Hydrococcus sp. RU_2_2]|nr:phycobilisome protein [Hydrococcus sp. RU_2_2]NJP18323.1 phycobilisome protein [Hydrococcus sp. CRU_1_1]